jgi:hypothetical protein
VRDYSASRELSRKIERRARPKASRGFRTTRPGGGTSRCMRLTPRVALPTAEQHEVERDDQREHHRHAGRADAERHRQAGAAGCRRQRTRVSAVR